MPIDPSSPRDVADALAAYLRCREVGFEAFAEAPAPVGRGFDTFIYSFRIAANARLNSAWDRRLVARIFGAPDRVETMRREAAVQGFVASRGYPALVPLAAEGPENPIGLPLMILPFAGPAALDVIKRNPLRMRSVFAAVGTLHARLHALPVDGFPLDPQNVSIDGHLAAAREYVDGAPSAGFDAALAWLEAERSRAGAPAPCLLHNDFHPLNVLVGDGGAMTVIDWSDARIGDRHYDVGRTIGLLYFAKIAATSRFERLVLLALRGPMRRWHIGGYERIHRLDRVPLHYWETYHTLRSAVQLAELGTSDAPLTDMARAIDPGLLDEAKSRLTYLIQHAP